MRPKISVIMAVHNTEKYVEEAINSILKQTFKDFEFIIIDDASTDCTRDIINIHKKLILLENKNNLGQAESFNKAMKIAKGEYIACMDADDIALPTRLEKQVLFLDKHPHIAVVGTWADVVNEHGERIGEIKFATEDKKIRRKMVERNQFIHPSIMFRACAAKEVNYYSNMRGAEDYDFLSRMLAKHKCANIPEKLMRYRMHTKSTSSLISKKLEWNALCVRWRMITKLGWPKWQLLDMGKPFISFLIPSKIKRALLRLRFHKVRNTRTLP